MSDVLSVDLAIYFRYVVGGLSHMSDVLSIDLVIYVRCVVGELSCCFHFHTKRYES